MLPKIHKRVQEKGWAFYHMEDQMPVDLSLSRGPAKSLESGRQYTLLPQVPQPTNPNYIMNAASDLTARGVDGQVMLAGEPHSLVAIRFYQQHAVMPRFDDEPDILCSQQALHDGLHALPSITDIKMPIYAF